MGMDPDSRLSLAGRRQEVSSASSWFLAFLDGTDGRRVVSSDQGAVMLKELIAVLGIFALLVATMSVLAITFDVDVRILIAASLSIVLLTMVLLYRRSRRSAPDVPAACHVAV